MGKRILVIGGVAAGATAAAKARRTDETAEITILEKNGYVSFANCGIPYYIGNVIKSRNSLLLQNAKSLKKRYNIDVFTYTEAIRIDPDKKIVFAKNNSDENLTFQYDKLILCNGAKTIIPPIDGISEIDHFTVRSIEDMDNIKDFIEEHKPESACVIGAGYIGIETSEALMHCGLEVTVVEALPHILPTFSPEVSLKIYEKMVSCGITLKTETKIVKAYKQDNKIILLSEKGESFTTDLLIIATGVKPDIELAKTAGLEIGSSGGVRVNSRMETSVADIYAAGDLVEKKDIITGNYILAPLAGPANREGRVAGCNAAGGNLEYKGTLRTAIVSFENACCAQTGLSYKEAIKFGYDAHFTYTEDPNHVEYYPDPKYIFIKLIFDKKTGKILGAEASGENGVERRIDIISTTIFAGLTVYDLGEIDFCYSPPYGAAKDPVNISGLVATNFINSSNLITPQQFLEIYSNELQILDVRTRIEFKSYRVKNAINIYLNDLRESLEELNKNKPVYIYCAVGYRGYVATKLLRNYGFDAYNISGGIEAIKRVAKIKNMEVIDAGNS